jgi:hypothetical protein
MMCMKQEGLFNADIDDLLVEEALFDSMKK